MSSRRYNWAALLMISALSVSAETRRLAVVVGNNAGTGDMPPLRYAENDAGKMARVLVELGEVSQDDLLLLQGRSAADVESALVDAKERVLTFKRNPDTRTVVLFYFSGHSDGESIELGRDRLAYARLKALLLSTGADVRVSIVDACRSGAGILQKGGKKADAFSIRLHDSLNTTGDAFITSSAEDEAALESSEVRGSFFTHNFISGLRGAADASGDRQVTLAEAYRYAYDRTVSATSALPVGAQHPSFDFKLSGQGELVLASLQRATSTLVLPAADRALVTDLSRDQVIAELPAGQQRELAIVAGTYGIRLFQGAQGFAGRVQVVENSRKMVELSDLSPLSAGVAVAAKGGPSEVSQQVPQAKPYNAFTFGIGFGVAGRVLTDPARAPGPKLQGRLWADVLTTKPVSLAGGKFLGSLTVAGVGESSFDSTGSATLETANEAGASLRLGYRLGIRWSELSVGVQVEVGPGFLMQRYGSFASAWTANADARLVGRYWVNPSFAVQVDGALGVLGVNVQTLRGSQFQFFTLPGVNVGIALAL